jgi:hypothetical protein
VWFERLRARARCAAQIPWAGWVVPDLGRNDIREVFLRTYRIVYLITESTVAGNFSLSPGKKLS